MEIFTTQNPIQIFAQTDDTKSYGCWIHTIQCQKKSSTYQFMINQLN